RLMLHAWPDNLRGIDRLVHHFHSDPSLAIYDLPASWMIEAPPSSREAAPEERRRRERLSKEELIEALAKHDGSVRATAKYLGRERRLIYRWMDLYGLREK
ncbi:MAG TPA: helix-turn-helix domain-containing protein, partial [Polyangiaceae bacterium]|nr:helix-turn-helix domain-containing protein [Polyangiaceae bacterium]